MKTQEDIEKRLTKLRLRYANKYIQASQERRHSNCVFNESHQVSVLPYTKTQSIEMPVAPRAQSTVVVFQDLNHGPVHLCMYGAENQDTWRGSICDSDNVAQSCPMFEPRTNVTAAKQEFIELLADDEYVFNHYRDIATLQWVLGERIHDTPFSLLDHFITWIRSKFIHVTKPVPKLAPPLSEDLWNDSSSNT